MPRINIWLAGLIGALIVGGWFAFRKMNTDPYFGQDWVFDLGGLTPYALVGLIIGGLFARIWNIFAKK